MFVAHVDVFPTVPQGSLQTLDSLTDVHALVPIDDDDSLSRLGGVLDRKNLLEVIPHRRHRSVDEHDLVKRNARPCQSTPEEDAPSSDLDLWMLLALVNGQQKACTGDCHLSLKARRPICVLRLSQ